MARREGRSIEETARRERYEFLSAVAIPSGALVATGHTADDRLETLLLALDRGEGLRGLAGIRPRRDDGVVRPLLPFRRGELREWLTSRRIAWREDPSNSSPNGGKRSRIRSLALPAIERALGPGLIARAGRSMDDLLDRVAAEPGEPRETPAESLDLAAASELPRARRRDLVTSYLRGAAPAPPSGRTVEAILAAAPERSSRLFSLPSGAGALLEAGRLRVVAGVPPPFFPDRPARNLPIPGVVELPEGLGRLRASLGRGPTPDLHPPGVRSRLVVPAAAIESFREGGVSVRFRRRGDRIRPLGAGGERKVKELLIDRKCPRSERDRMPILLFGEEPVWIPGYAIAEGLRWPMCEFEAIFVDWEGPR